MPWEVDSTWLVTSTVGVVVAVLSPTSTGSMDRSETTNSTVDGPRFWAGTVLATVGPAVVVKVGVLLVVVLLMRLSAWGSDKGKLPLERVELWRDGDGDGALCADWMEC